MFKQIPIFWNAQPGPPRKMPKEVRFVWKYFCGTVCILTLYKSHVIAAFQGTH